MQKVYCYAALLNCFVFLFQALKSSNYIGAFLLAVIALFICSKMYRFQAGEKLKTTVEQLPVLIFLSFIFRDEKITTEQNRNSLGAILFAASLALSMLVSFIMFASVVNHLLLMLGCLSFALMFSYVMLRRYSI